MSRHMQMPEGKRIHIYRSGDAHYKGVSVVVNPKCLKSFDSLLAEATTKVDATWGAVRSIHTPNTGTVVDSLGNLRQHGAYVAAGPMGFVSIPGGYENIGKAGLMRKVTSQMKVIHLRPVQKNDMYNVFMYRNGDPAKAVPFKFSRADFANWEEALTKLSEKVRLPNGPVKRIYHLTGKILSKPEELVNKGSYVAAASNELFHKANYGDQSKEEAEVGSGYKGSKYYKAPVKGSQNPRTSSQELTTINSKAKSLGRRRGRKKSGKTKKEKEGTGTKEIVSTEFHEENEHPWREREEEEEEGEGDVEERGYEEEEIEGAEDGDDGALTGKGRPTSGSRRRVASVTSSKVSTRRARSSRSNQSRRSRQASLESNADTPEDGYESSYSKHKSSGNPYGIPKQIPESDFSKVDYFSLSGASQQNSPQESPLMTPVNSKPSSPRDFNYRSQGQYNYPFHETIAEESEGEIRPVHTNRDQRADSRLSMYDSGHASLFSDEDRPDSVFRAKQTHSRPKTRAVEVNYDTDDGGIYRSKKRAEYSRGALEILDSTDTNIELPVDLMDAVEIQEEVYAT